MAELQDGMAEGEATAVALGEAIGLDLASALAPPATLVLAPEASFAADALSLASTLPTTSFAAAAVAAAAAALVAAQLAGRCHRMCLRARVCLHALDRLWRRRDPYLNGRGSR